MSGRPSAAADGQLDAFGRSLEMLAVLAAGLVLGPGLLAGGVVMLLARVLRLHWSWALLVALGCAAPLALDPAARAARVQALAVAALDRRGISTAEVADVLWPLWLVVAGVSAVAMTRRLERRT